MRSCIYLYCALCNIIVYGAITNDFKVLKVEVEQIIKEQIDKKIFDIEELKLCKESNYYKYVDFEKIM